MNLKIFALMTFTFFLTSNSFSAELEPCKWNTHCSTKCAHKNGDTSFGYFCMFGTVCNPDSHRCEKAEVRLMNHTEGTDGSKKNVDLKSSVKNPRVKPPKPLNIEKQRD